MIVVDSNILAYFYLEGEHTAAATALYKQDPAWAAPQLWRSEFRNILAGYMRRGSLSLEQAMERQLAAQELLTGREYVVDSRGVLELVASSACTAYDCEFVALAVQLNAKLVTLDAKLLRAFPLVVVDLATAIDYK